MNAAVKPFAWSYSKVKNFESCPRRYKRVDVDKAFKDESEQLDFGNKLHDALAAYIGKGTTLPSAFAAYKNWADKVKDGDGFTILVEQKYAIRQDMSPTTWFGKDVWYRGIADVVKMCGPVALAVDWKTGKVLEDGVQLALMAQCLFSHYPELQVIRTEFIWLKEDATTREDFKRDDMASIWAGVLPRVAALQHAHTTNEFNPKPGYLCRKFCPVIDCEHNGRR